MCQDALGSQFPPCNGIVHVSRVWVWKRWGRKCQDVSSSAPDILIWQFSVFWRMFFMLKPENTILFLRPSRRRFNLHWLVYLISTPSTLIRKNPNWFWFPNQDDFLGQREHTLLFHLYSGKLYNTCHHQLGSASYKYLHVSDSFSFTLPDSSRDQFWSLRYFFLLSFLYVSFSSTLRTFSLDYWSG